MKKNLYVIYDCLAKETGPVFEAKNDDVSRRAADNLLSATPEKYRDSFILLFIGSVDDEGTLTPCNPVREVKKDAEII